MNWKQDTKEFKLKTEEYDKVKYICKCGNRVIIPKWLKKRTCDWCGNYVFKTKKDEDIYRIMEKLNKIRRDNY